MRDLGTVVAMIMVALVAWNLAGYSLAESLWTRTREELLDEDRRSLS
jgi:hypothetical protein